MLNHLSKTMKTMVLDGETVRPADNHGGISGRHSTIDLERQGHGGPVDPQADDLPGVPVSGRQADALTGRWSVGEVGRYMGL